MSILLSVLVAVIGILIYALAANPKVQEMGRIAFFCGLLVFLFGAEQVVALLGR
jgi:Na+/phosphate symporter